MIIRPGLLLDVVTGELLAGRAVIIDGQRIARVTGVRYAAEEGAPLIRFRRQYLSR